MSISPPLARRSSGSTARVSMLAKPCSSKVREIEAITSRSTARAAGSSSGKPLSGVGRLMGQSPRVTWPGRAVVGEVEQERVGGALAADRGLLAVPGQHHDVVGQGEHLGAQGLEHRGVVAAGQVGAPDRAGEEQVAGEHHLGDVVGLVRRTEGDRALGVARRVVDGDREAGQLEALPVGELGDVVGLDELVAPAEQHRGGLAGDAGHRVGEQVTVGGVDPGGGVVGARDRGHRPHVVDVAVGEQDGDGLEAVLADDLGDAGGGVLAGVDDHALRAGAGGHDVAVGGPRTRWEPGDQHPGRLSTARCVASMGRCRPE